MAALLTIFGLLSLWNVDAASDPPVATSRLRSPQILLGYCAGTRGSWDPAKLLIVENQSMPLPRSMIVAEMNGESVIYRHLPENNLTIFDIDALADPNADLDIIIRLALYDGNAAIYWKETYQHRSYRQGIILLGDRPQVFCEGRGGADSSH